MAKKNKPTKKVRERVAKNQGMQQTIDLTFTPKDAQEVHALLQGGSFQLQGNLVERFAILKAKIAHFAQSAPPADKPAPKPEKENES